MPHLQLHSNYLKETVCSNMKTALNALFDRAFDRGMFTFDDNLSVIVSSRLRGATSNVRLCCSLDAIHGRTIVQPDRFPPDPEALKFHRMNVFAA